MLKTSPFEFLYSKNIKIPCNNRIKTNFSIYEV